jgi:S1-C subfamily serine protease
METRGDAKADWGSTIARVTPGIVSMRVNSVRSHEGFAASFSYATGFVVDAERGIILSNRHVVTTGPIQAEAVFSNKEEVPVIPIYRDPVSRPEERCIGRKCVSPVRRDNSRTHSFQALTVAPK